MNKDKREVLAEISELKMKVPSNEEYLMENINELEDTIKYCPDLGTVNNAIYELSLIEESLAQRR